MTTPQLDPDKIRQHFDARSYQRGQKYQKSGEVLNLSLRDNTLSAYVQGSDTQPYHVQITLEHDDIADAYCTCPYDWGGYCKHIAAVVLEYMHEPNAVQQEVSLETMLKPLKQQELRALLEHIWHHHPEIHGNVQHYLQNDTSGKSNQKATEPKEASANISIDTALYTNMMRDAVNRSSIDWDGYPDYDAAHKVLEKVRPFLAKGNFIDALAIAEALLHSFVDTVNQRDDDYAMDGVGFSDETIVETFDYALAEAILGAKPSQKERKRLLTEVLAWQDAMANEWHDAELSYSGAALLQDLDVSEDEEAKELASAITDLHEYEKKGFAAMQLRVMKHTDASDEAKRLEFAKKSGQGLSYLKLLLEFNQQAKAMQEYPKQLSNDADKLEFARLLKRNYPEDALRVIEQQFARYMPKGFQDLAQDYKSTIEEYIGYRREEVRYGMAQLVKTIIGKKKTHPELLYQAYLVMFRYKPSLKDYQKLQHIAGKGWTPLQAKLLAFIQEPTYSKNAQTAAVDILLHETMHEEAIRYVSDKEMPSDLIQKVMKVVMPDFPKWVMGVAKHKAEAIVSAGKSNLYAEAVTWLSLAKDTHTMHGTALEWERYILVIAEQYKRKRNFIKELQAIHKT